MTKRLFSSQTTTTPIQSGSVVQSCLPHECDILIVDDGSDTKTKRKIAQAALLSKHVHVLTLPVNSGKGGAVLAGFQWAIDRQYTHVFQLDADGQQDAMAIGEFLESSAKHPQALICGYPIYDESVPLFAKMGTTDYRFFGL